MHASHLDDLVPEVVDYVEHSGAEVRTPSSSGQRFQWYAVARGTKRGVYASWPECEAQVRGFRGALYKGFNDQREAFTFVGNQVEADDFNAELERASARKEGVEASPISEQSSHFDMTRDEPQERKGHRQTGRPSTQQRPMQFMRTPAKVQQSGRPMANNSPVVS